MSKGKRHTPIFGHIPASFQAGDKRLRHKRWRAQQRAALASALAARRGRPLPEQMELQARMLAGLRSN